MAIKRVIKLSGINHDFEVMIDIVTADDGRVGGSVVSTLHEPCEFCDNAGCEGDCPELMEILSDRDLDCRKQKADEIEERVRYNLMIDAL